MNGFLKGIQKHMQFSSYYVMYMLFIEKQQNCSK